MRYAILDSVKSLDNYLNPNGVTIVITTKFFSKSTLVRNILNGSGSNTHLYMSVRPNPDYQDLKELIQIFFNKQPTNIIAIGGGSAIDVAKILSLVLSAESEMLACKILKNESGLEQKKIKLIAIPTTSGSGAEITPFATIWNRSLLKKYSIESLDLVPEIVLYDDTITTTLSLEETINTSLDALSHALESLWNKNISEGTRAQSMQALYLWISSFPQLLCDLKNCSARRDMQECALLAGMAIARTRTAIAHAISYPLTLRYGVPHGLACGFTLEAIIGNNIKIIARNDLEHQLFVSISRVLGNLKLPKLITKYATVQEISNLEFNNFERVGNYHVDITPEKLKALTLISLESL